MNKKKITFRKLLEAMRLDGYEQGRFDLWHTTYDEDTGKSVIGSACALGQAILNLGITTGNLHIVDAIDYEKFGYTDPIVAPNYFLSERLQEITDANDHKYHTLGEIADILEKKWAEEGILDLALESNEVDYSEKFLNYQGVKA